MKYDLIILGAGPAGLTAALYAARTGLKVAVIAKEIGGTTNSILLLENWPGYKGSGNKLMKQFYNQVKEYKVQFMLEEASTITKSKNGFLVKTQKQEIESKAILLSTGTERRKINIKGEKELIGRGVSYCVTCDSFFFKGKTVAVIGGSDCAATSALALADITKKVYVIYRGETLRCEEINSERLEKLKNVEIIYNATPTEIIGKEKVEAIKITQKNKEREIKLDGIFIEIGSIALTQLAQNLGLKLDKENHVVVDENMTTNVAGFFAAGDVTNQKLKQVIVSSGQGAIAAKSAHDYIKS